MEANWEPLQKNLEQIKQRIHREAEFYKALREAYQVESNEEALKIFAERLEKIEPIATFPPTENSSAE